jgi:transcriptional regulator with XRE-family HTH domain
MTKKIKQSYIALKSGMNTNKVSRILNQTQIPNEQDMDSISKALGKSMEFFVSSNFKIDEPEYNLEQVAFYSGNVNGANSKVVSDCIDLLENIHSILGREKTLVDMINEELYEN